MESIWKKDAASVSREPLTGDLRINTAVIGGGMCGILTAALLKEKGIDAAVFEANEVGSGVTSGTTAKITAQHGLKYDYISEKFGREAAKKYASLNTKAIEEFDRLVSSRGIDCCFEPRDAYLYTASNDSMLEREYRAASEAGIQAELVSVTELPIKVSSALRFRGQASFHPLKFLYAMSKELDVYEHSRARIENEHVIRTENGSVYADNIVFACHFPFINVPGYYFAKMYQSRSCVLALSGAQRFDGMYYGIDEDGVSLRPHGDLILFGGGGYRSGENLGGRYEFLRRRASELFPCSREETCWSSQDCMTLDSLPYIGRFSASRKNWYVASGFGKWGMTSSMAAALVISDMIAGKRSRSASVVSPIRVLVPSGAKQLIKNAGKSASGLVAGLGENRGVCTHLGCALNYNSDEDTLECPCHGSRFTKDGKLINGPAQYDLKKQQG